MAANRTIDEQPPDALTYCRFCGGVIFKVVGGYRAAKKENDWCQHMPEGQRKLN